MLKRRLQIKRISPASATDVTYEVSHEAKRGGEFFISIEGERLKDFLREKLCLSEDSVSELLHEIHHKRAAVLDPVEEAAAS